MKVYHVVKILNSVSLNEKLLEKTNLLLTLFAVHLTNLDAVNSQTVKVDLYINTEHVATLTTTLVAGAVDIVKGINDFALFNWVTDITQLYTNIIEAKWDNANIRLDKINLAGVLV